MKLLLDTNVISESVRSQPNRKVLTWLSGQLREDLAISAITLAELRDGALTARDEIRRRTIQHWLDNEIEADFEHRMVAVSVEVLVDWTQLSRKLRLAGKSRNPADMLIAATARVHDLTVVTRNVRDFADTGVDVYDPWHDQTHRMDPP